ncbi:hypothetical protein TR2A62_3240 [Thalassobium sp. R2A62]|nr:hypothetical protein TR2A62_3240 [Thalassobium sp. R2A62]
MAEQQEEWLQTNPMSASEFDYEKFASAANVSFPPTMLVVITTRFLKEYRI